MKTNSKEFSQISSDRKKRWWDTVKKDPKLLSEFKAKLSKNNARNFLGKSMDKSPTWKGGKYRDKRDGYIFVRDLQHPFKRSDGYILEHRLVMENILGRYLTPDEDVNHLNGKKDDNRPENLRVVRHYAHYEEMRCPKCDFKFLTR